MAPAEEMVFVEDGAPVKADKEEKSEDNKTEDDKAESAEVVSLDAFRKK